MRPVTWVTIEEVTSGEWGIGGKALHTGDVVGMRAGDDRDGGTRRWTLPLDPDRPLFAAVRLA